MAGYKGNGVTLIWHRTALPGLCLTCKVENEFFRARR